MATQQVNQIHVAVKTLTTSDLERQEEEAKKRADRKKTVFDVPEDSVDIKVSDSKVAQSGEAKAPSRGTKHYRLKGAHTKLLDSLKKAGTEIKPNEENVKAKAQNVLEDLETKIAKLVEKGGQEEKVAELQKQQTEILEALASYETIQAESSQDTMGIASAEETVGSNEVHSELTSEQTETLWGSLEEDLKVLNLEVKPTESDLESIQNKATVRFEEEFGKLKTQETGLKTRQKELEAQLKTASPNEKKRIETELKTIKAELQQILQQKQALHASFLKVSETLAHFQAANDLGLNLKEEKKKTIQSASAVKKEESPQKKGAMVGTASATSSKGMIQNSQDTGESSYVTAGGQPQVGETSGNLVGTASVEEGDGALTGETSVVGVNAFNDFSGTTLAIASTGNNLRREANKTEKEIKKLMRAVLSGNYEAIKTALILLDKRAGQLVTTMGAATIKAMGYYEKQMSQLGESLGKLNSTDSSYNAKLAQVNSQMNMYSMNRQSIANFLQTTMTTREEIANTTKGFMSKDGQISASISRWG